MRAAYVMMVHSKHRAASAVRGSILCRDTLLYSASAAVPKLIISQVTILILPKPWKKLLHYVMQYSDEGPLNEQNKGSTITPSIKRGATKAGIAK